MPWLCPVEMKLCLNGVWTIVAMCCWLSKSHKDSEEGKGKGGVEDWRKLILSPVITFSYSGKAVKTTMTVASMMILEPSQSVKSENNEVSSGSDE